MADLTEPPVSNYLTNHDRAHFKTYARILDGVVAGADSAEIADVMWCGAQLSTTAPGSPLAPLLSCQPSFLALLLASRTAPDFSESHGCFRDTLLLSRFLFDPLEASGRKLGRFLPGHNPPGTARRDGQRCRRHREAAGAGGERP
jgi:hypothetical protein